MIKFIVNEIKFMSANDMGLKFVTEVKLHECNKYIEVNKFKVDVHKQFDGEFDFADKDDTRPDDIYSFDINRYGDCYVINKKFIYGEYFKPHTIVGNKIEFINQFLNDYSGLSPYSLEDKRKLSDYGSIEIEVWSEDDTLIESVLHWCKNYNMNSDVVEADSDNVYKYYIPSGYEENDCEVKILNMENNPRHYLSTLLNHKWIETYKLEVNVLDMLYDLKEKIPFNIQIEQIKTDDGRVVYKRSELLNKVRSLIYTLSESDTYQLADLYTALKNEHDKHFKPIEKPIFRQKKCSLVPCCEEEF
jgi:hypothetical protein